MNRAVSMSPRPTCRSYPERNRIERKAALKWADVIDLLTLNPNARREVARMVGELGS
jgi:hypothetical protein